MTTATRVGAELVEDVEWLMSFGTPPEQVAKQTQSTIEAIEGALRRAGKSEPANLFGKARKDARASSSPSAPAPPAPTVAAKPPRKERVIMCEVNLGGQAPLVLRLKWRTTVEIAEDIQRVVTRTIPDLQVVLDLDGDLRLTGTGYVEAEDRRRLGTIRLRRASQEQYRRAA